MYHLCFVNNPSIHLIPLNGTSTESKYCKLIMVSILKDRITVSLKKILSRMARKLVSNPQVVSVRATDCITDIV